MLRGLWFYPNITAHMRKIWISVEHQKTGINVKVAFPTWDLLMRGKMFAEWCLSSLLSVARIIWARGLTAIYGLTAIINGQRGHGHNVIHCKYTAINSFAICFYIIKCHTGPFEWLQHSLYFTDYGVNMRRKHAIFSKILSSPKEKDWCPAGINLLTQ